MGCRIGMTMDVTVTVTRLKLDGTVPAYAKCSVLAEGLSYTQAVAQEGEHRGKCGTSCQSSARGGFVDGNLWTVYRIDW